MGHNPSHDPCGQEGHPNKKTIPWESSRWSSLLLSLRSLHRVPLVVVPRSRTLERPTLGPVRTFQSICNANVQMTYTTSHIGSLCTSEGQRSYAYGGAGGAARRQIEALSTISLTPKAKITSQRGKLYLVSAISMSCAGNQGARSKVARCTDQSKWS